MHCGTFGAEEGNLGGVHPDQRVVGLQAETGEVEAPGPVKHFPSTAQTYIVDTYPLRLAEISLAAVITVHVADDVGCGMGVAAGL